MWRWTSSGFGSGHIRPRLTCTRRGLAVCGLMISAWLDHPVICTAVLVLAAAVTLNFFSFRDHNGIEQLIMLLMIWRIGPGGVRYKATFVI